MAKRKPRGKPKITREQRRLFKRSLPAYEDDRLWFLGRPDRTFRVRLASAAEAALAQSSGITPEGIAAAGPGAVVVTITKQLAPGMRLRKWCVSTDIPLTNKEWMAEWGAWAWELLGGDGAIGACFTAHNNAEQRL